MKIPTDWSADETRKKISREFDFKTFREALEFVNQVGELAETANHHPNIQISYTNVLLVLSTHSAEEVTDKDVDLALKINDLPV